MPPKREDDDKIALARMQERLDRLVDDVEELKAEISQSEARTQRGIEELSVDLDEHSKVDAAGFKELNEAVSLHRPWAEFSEWLFKALAAAALAYIAWKVGLQP